MPQYLFQHKDTQEVRTIILRMNDEKIYNGEKGDEIGVWERLWTVPAGIVDGKMNPWSPRQFVEKTGRSKDSYGSLLDRSAEMSEQRAKESGGVDPLKTKLFDSYERKTRKEHPQKTAERLKNLEIEI